MESPSIPALRKIKSISDYQFGNDITDILFNKEEILAIERSKNTKKIRYLYYDNNLLLSLRPTNGFFTLSLFSARKIINNILAPRLRIIVLTDISEFIKKGRNVFCKHVVEVDSNLRPLDEVIVVNQEDELLAIGRLKLPVDLIQSFKTGIAVMVRKGVNKSKN